MKQTEYFGFGSLKSLKRIFEKENIKNVFLVTGKSSYESCGAKHKIEKIFQETSCAFTRFSDFFPNPKLEEIKKGGSLFNNQSYDAIVAVGGGSVIDVAKKIKMDFIEKNYGKQIPLIAIPTTAGSGSEATYFIAYYEENKKKSAGKPEITLPNYSIIDPTFMYSLPKRIIASTGMDALSQAVESYWSINSTKDSKELSSKSIRLIIKNLKEASNHSKDSINQMARSSNLSGKAINITKTTACHSISYPITAHFNVPHGHAVGLTLGEMLYYNYNIKEDCNDKRGPDYVKRTIEKLSSLLGAKDPENARKVIRDLMVSIGLDVNLSSLGISNNGINIIISEGFTKERVNNNPRVLTKENLRNILRRIS